MRDWIRRLVDHMEWADCRTLEAVRERGDVDARRLLAHVLAAEDVWLARLETGDSTGMEIWPDFDAGRCEASTERLGDAYRGLLASLSERDLGETVTYRNSRGATYRTPVGEVLLHVSLHGEHHRGQISRRIRAAGGKPVNTDFITYVRGHPVAPDQR